MSTRLCGCAAAPHDELSLDIFPGEGESEARVRLTAGSEGEREQWVEAIRRSSGPPVTAESPKRKGGGSENPAAQLQEAIRQDREEGERRRRELEQAEIRWGVQPVFSRRCRVLCLYGLWGRGNFRGNFCLEFDQDSPHFWLRFPLDGFEILSAQRGRRPR